MGGNLVYGGTPEAIAPSYVPAFNTTFTINADSYIHIINVGGYSDTVTVGGAYTVVVPAGTQQIIGPFNFAQFGTSLSVTHSYPTDIYVAIVNGEGSSGGSVQISPPYTECWASAFSPTITTTSSNNITITAVTAQCWASAFSPTITAGTATSINITVDTAATCYASAFSPDISTGLPVHETSAVVQFTTWPAWPTLTVTNEGTAGSGYNGTLAYNRQTTTPSGNTADSFSNCLGNDRLTIPSGSSIDDLGNFTVEILFKYHSGGASTQFIWSKGWWYSEYYGGYLCFIRYHISGCDQYDYPITFVDGQWYDIQLTWDATPGNMPHVWINDVDHSNDLIIDQLGNGDYHSDVGQPIYVMSYHVAGDATLGDLTVFRLHNGILTDTQRHDNFVYDMVRTIGAGVNIVTVTATAAADAVLPLCIYEETVITPPVSTATADVLVPVINLGDTIIYADTATVTSEALIPTVYYETLILPPTVIATGEALIPTIDAGGTFIYAVTAEATADTLAPSVAGSCLITAITATGNANAEIPTLNVQIVITAVTATSEASASSPVLTTISYACIESITEAWSSIIETDATVSYVTETDATVSYPVMVSTDTVSYPRTVVTDTATFPGTTTASVTWPGITSLTIAWCEI